MSGDSLVAMIDRARSSRTVVCSGGRGSSSRAQPSSHASRAAFSKRPAMRDTAPRALCTWPALDA